jgi:hypothetical protein
LGVIDHDDLVKLDELSGSVARPAPPYPGEARRHGLHAHSQEPTRRVVCGENLHKGGSARNRRPGTTVAFPLLNPRNAPREAATTVRQPRAYGTHSLRRTKVALVYKKTGNLRACPLLLGHRKLERALSAQTSRPANGCGLAGWRDPGEEPVPLL